MIDNVMNPLKKQKTIGELSLNKCPAFKNGCPFALKPLSDQNPMHSLSSCPAFAEGCPFKNVKTAGDLKLALGQVPSSHAVEGSKAQLALVHVLGVTHKQSVAAKLELTGGKSCPVFATECPFKKVDALRQSAESEWRGWWTHHDEGDDDEREESGALSAQLKEGTQEAHAEAERVQFVRALLERRAPLAAYCALLAALRIVYVSLETAAERTGLASTDPQIRLICVELSSMLRRVEMIDRDLDHFATIDAQAVSEAKTWAMNSLAVTLYARRLAGLDDPELLVAHLYTRYLGDLSGGQILKRAVKRAYLGNDDSRGVDLYNFPNIGGPVQLRKFKNLYRQALDALHLADVRPVVEEAVRAFRYNTALLMELDAMLLQAPPASVERCQQEDAPKVCPFLAGKNIPASGPQKCPFASNSKPKRATNTSSNTKSACPLHSLGFRDLVVVALLAFAFIFATHHVSVIA